MVINKNPTYNTMSEEDEIPLWKRIDELRITEPRYNTENKINTMSEDKSVNEIVCEFLLSLNKGGNFSLINELKLNWEEFYNKKQAQSKTIVHTDRDYNRRRN